MSALNDGPPHVLRTPSEHFHEADRLLHEVAQSRDPGLPFMRQKIARAQVHALLAGCAESFHVEGWEAEYDAKTAVDCMLARETVVKVTGDRL